MVPFRCEVVCEPLQPLEAGRGISQFAFRRVSVSGCLTGVVRSLLPPEGFLSRI